MKTNSNYVCFIVPPHIEKKTQQNEDAVSEEVRRRRIGARVFKRSLAIERPRNENLDDQDVFSAKRTYYLPGWKLADTEADADYSYNKSVNPCWDNTQDVLKFYNDVLGFDLKAHLNGQVVSTVDFGKYFNNAFFNGEQMAYGEGDGRFFKDFCFDYTVVCHELGHGVVDATVPLVYNGDSGALNESYADVFAICFQHYKLQKSVNELNAADWMIGEICVVGEGALRSFTKQASRPSHHPLGPDGEPRHLAQKYTGEEDNGGVHINSGIINHAFYKACKYIGGNSWELPLQIWFSLLKEHSITPYASFDEFGKTLMKRAKEMGGTEIEHKIWQALADVGFRYAEPTSSVPTEEPEEPAEPVEESNVATSGGCCPTNKRRRSRRRRLQKKDAE
jgi:Zn-dependent metalloprotease